MTTALVGGFFLKISIKNRVFDRIVHLAFCRSTKKEK
jgi:hypothetical protein